MKDFMNALCSDEGGFYIIIIFIFIIFLIAYFIDTATHNPDKETIPGSNNQYISTQEFDTNKYKRVHYVCVPTLIGESCYYTTD